MRNARPHQSAFDPAITDPALAADAPVAQAIDKVVLLMVSGLSEQAVAGACQQKLGMTPAKAKAAIRRARKLITLAADYNRDEQIGKAVVRLEDLYSRSLRVQDTKTALAAQRELNKLLDLYRPPGRADDADADADAEGQAGPLEWPLVAGQKKSKEIA